MTVVVGVDRTERAQSVIEEASKLSESFNVQLHVVHVISQSDFIDIEQTKFEKTGEAADKSELREMAKEVSTEAAADVDTEYEPIGLVGNPSKELVQYAEANGADYLVIGGRKRSPIGKALFGSVTQSVLLDSSISVLTVPST